MRTVAALALPFFPDAKPFWGLVAFAAPMLAAALGALAWGLTCAMRRPLVAGCALLGGGTVALLAVFVLLYGLNLTGNVGR